MQGLDLAELERRKRQIRDLWGYRTLDHIPIWLTACANPWGYSLQDQFGSAEKQFAVQMATIERTLSSVPDDIIPVLQPSLVSGNETGVALGAEVYWGYDTEQPPSIRRPRVRSADDVDALAMAAWREHSLLTEWLHRIAWFAQNAAWPLCLNLIGPTDISLAISDAAWFYETIATDPQLIDRLYRVAVDATMGLTDLAVAAAGGQDRVTGIGARIWCPEGYMGYVSDDVATAISPRAFQRLNRPANDRIFERYGAGVMHVCGPHPSAQDYLGGRFPPRAFTASWRYSEEDLAPLSRAMAGKAVLYLELTDYQIWEDPDVSPLVARYRRAVEIFAPTTLVVAYLQVGQAVDGSALYAELRSISERYASAMNWPAVKAA